MKDQMNPFFHECPYSEEYDADISPDDDELVPDTAEAKGFPLSFGSSFRGKKFDDIISKYFSSSSESDSDSAGPSRSRRRQDHTQEYESFPDPEDFVLINQAEDTEGEDFEMIDDSDVPLLPLPPSDFDEPIIYPPHMVNQIIIQDELEDAMDAPLPNKNEPPTSKGKSLHEAIVDAQLAAAVDCLGLDPSILEGRDSMSDISSIDECNPINCTRHMAFVSEAGKIAEHAKILAEEEAAKAERRRRAREWAWECDERWRLRMRRNREESRSRSPSPAVRTREMYRERDAEWAKVVSKAKDGVEDTLAWR